MWLRRTPSRQPVWWHLPPEEDDGGESYGRTVHPPCHVERSSCHANYFNRDSKPYPSSSPDAMHAINPKIWTDHVIIDSDLSSFRAWGVGAVKPAMRSPLNPSNPHLPPVLLFPVLRFRFGA
ncbi:hypothetical protein B296_00033267 [Ensete ventricosum]|uniref:Uncharacterized protein n=1 Tax=Ensete ventricosum TaxID=4639 RepID=A0A426X7H9_ENSVE|nr:hypothetical protein B296_00033267 [Ensete ventricosum]